MLMCGFGVVIFVLCVIGAQKAKADTCYPLNTCLPGDIEQKGFSRNTGFNINQGFKSLNIDIGVVELQRHCRLRYDRQAHLGVHGLSLSTTNLGSTGMNFTGPEIDWDSRGCWGYPAISDDDMTAESRHSRTAREEFYPALADEDLYPATSPSRVPQSATIAIFGMGSLSLLCARTR